MNQPAPSPTPPPSPSNAPTTNQTTPTPQPAPESATQANVGAPTAGLPDQAPPPETATPEQTRTARAIAQAAKRERHARERERVAAQRWEVAEQARKAAEQQKAEIESLFQSAGKDKTKALELLQKAGYRNVDDLARVFLDLEPAKNTVEQEIEALKAQLAATQEENRKANEARQAYEGRLAEQRAIENIRSVVSADPDKYELLIDGGYYPEVLKRGTEMLHRLRVEKNVQQIQPHEWPILIHTVAQSVEDDLLESAKAAYGKVSKYKKLGITPHSDDPNGPSQSKDSNTAPSPPLQGSNARPPGKFITNENTVSTASIPADPPQSDWRKKEDSLVEEVKEHMKRQRLIREQQQARKAQ